MKLMETRKKTINSQLIKNLADDAALDTGEFIARLVTLYQLMPFNNYLLRVVEMFPNLNAMIATISLWSKLDRDHIPIPILEDELDVVLNEPKTVKELYSVDKKIKL
jgi:hypothetical protein